MKLALSAIDDLTRPDHFYLREEHRCFYLRVYTAKKGFAHSETNNLISNLKKSPDKKNTPQWTHKERAIEKLGEELRDALPDAWLRQAVFVPMPPSARKEDPLYDDRLLRVLNIVDNGRGLDIRELLYQTMSTPPEHRQDGPRKRPQERASLFKIDSTKVEPSPKEVIIFDDMLTTGSHFVAARQVILETYPGIEVWGVFIARREIADSSDESAP